MTESKPAIVAIDGHEANHPFLRSELTARYGAHYRVVIEHSIDAALRDLQTMVRNGDEVAIILADHQAGGADALEAAHSIHPHAKRALLLRWGENRAAREEIADALARGHVDYFVVAPVASPDERFHRAITEFLDEWWRLRGVPFEAIRVVGDPGSARTHEICDLLHRHDFPYGFYASDSEPAQALLAEAGCGAPNEAVVILRDGRALVDPTNVEVAEALGARTQSRPGVYDVVVIGGGPAGLAAAVTASSEGLRTALVEPVALGGQAGTSSMIRNYLGFPRGISGAELASRAVDQAILFGTEMIYGSAATALTPGSGRCVIQLSDGREVTGRTIIIATGVSYRSLNIAALEPFNGVGVFYGTAMSQTRSLTAPRVFVVGGGNSAGQAAIHLAKSVDHVTILVRSESLAASMSDYLVKDIDATPNIDVRYCAEVVDGGGDGKLEWLALKDCRTGEIEKHPAAALFVLIGACPFTDWLPTSIARDDWGYVLTGMQCEDPSCWAAACKVDTNEAEDTSGNHTPLLFETSLPAVFAVGDVRRGSIKRVASAAGEGAICIQLIHEYLSTAI